MCHSLSSINNCQCTGFLRSSDNLQDRIDPAPHITDMGCSHQACLIRNLGNDLIITDDGGYRLLVNEMALKEAYEFRMACESGAE